MLVDGYYFTPDRLHACPSVFKVHVLFEICSFRYGVLYIIQISHIMILVFFNYYIFYYSKNKLILFVLILILVCDGKPADIFFLLDSSSSIWSVDYKLQLQFLQDLVDSFPISQTEVRIGVGIFSHRYRTQFNFNVYDDKERLKVKFLKFKVKYIVMVEVTSTYSATNLLKSREIEMI